jgi:hypothetical protein
MAYPASHTHCATDWALSTVVLLWIWQAAHWVEPCVVE